MEETNARKERKEGKPEGKGPLGRPRLRWVANIKLDLVKIGCGSMDWTGLVQDRDKRKALVMNLGFHKMQGSSQVATQLVTCQVVLSSMQLVSQLVS
jgi:hypothetical protein